MSEPKSTYWRPRVMMHGHPNKESEYAIHEVYFTGEGDIRGWTENALSDRYKSVIELENRLKSYLVSEKEHFVCGDKEYTYHKNDIELWLKHINDGVIEYKD